MAASVTFSQRLVESIYAYGADDFQANAYDKHRALDTLVNRGQGFKDNSQAGIFVMIPVEVRTLGITQGVTEGSEYSLINVETDAGAQYRWVTAVTPMIFSDEELGENQGKQQIISTVKNKMSVAKRDHVDYLDNQFLNGTGAGTSSESLTTIIGSGNSGGLSSTTYPKWVGQTSNGGNLSAAVLDAAIDSTVFDASQGVDFLISNLTLFDRWKDISQSKTTIFQPNDETGTNQGYAGQELIQFRGAVWFWDRKVAAQTLFGVNSSQIRFFVQPGRDMEVFPEKVAPTQLAKHIPVVSRYQFAPLARRAHFVITGLGTS